MEISLCCSCWKHVIGGSDAATTGSKCVKTQRAQKDNNINISQVFKTEVTDRCEYLELHLSGWWLIDDILLSVLYQEGACVVLELGIIDTFSKRGWFGHASTCRDWLWLKRYAPRWNSRQPVPIREMLEAVTRSSNATCCVCLDNVAWYLISLRATVRMAP